MIGVLGGLALVMVILLQLVGRSIQQFDAKPAFACDPATNRDAAALPFCDTALHIEDRVKDLVGRLSLPEKADQLGDRAPAIPRLGIPLYEWWQEALHGVAYNPGVTFGGKVPGATSFPQVILTAAALNRTLWHQIGQAVSTEGRAMYNLGRSGLTFWSPNINIFRDPRWGRGQETPGEDPFVTSQYATSYVRGLQGQGLDGAAYDLDNWENVVRYHFNSVVTAQDLEDTYNVPFKECIEEDHVVSVMCSYNAVSGVPTCADQNLLTGKALNEWGLSGYIVSDCSAVHLISDSYNYTTTPEDTVAAALHAGLDLDCGTYIQENALRSLSTGKVDNSTIDRALGNLFATRMRLGLFDGDPTSQIYGNLGLESICSPEHQELAVEAARQGIVLLKNDNNLLPLTGVKTISLIGPHGDATTAMIGNYQGNPCQYISPRKGLEAYAQVTFTAGCPDVACTGSGFSRAAAAATAALSDVVVIVVGLDQSQEAEGRDRTTLLLPTHQQDLVQDSAGVAAAAGKRVVLVVMSGGPVDITFAKEDARIESILWVGYPGQAGGQALADILFGHHSPSEVLPVTWDPEQVVENLDMTNMNMRPDPATNYPGRTHRFYTGEVVYEFGHGIQGYHSQAFQAAFSAKLSPATFSLAAHGNRGSGSQLLRCSELGDAEPASFELHVQVSKNGSRDGSYTALLFSRSPDADSNDAPLKELVGFERLHVAAGSTADHAFTIRPCHHLSTVASDGTRVLKTGLHHFRLGHSFHSVSLTL